MIDIFINYNTKLKKGDTGDKKYKKTPLINGKLSRIYTKYT